MTRPHAFALATLMLGAPIVRAEPASAQAEALFKQGIELLDAGKLAEACTAFDASEKIEPTIATLLNQASCRDKNHQYATAWGLFLDAERQTRLAPDPQSQQFHATAAAHAAALEPRLSKVTINVPRDSQLESLQVTRGSEGVEAGTWNRALPVDGGTYAITVRAPAHDPWTTTIVIAEEGDVKTVDVPLLRLSPVPPPPHRAKLPFILGGAAVVVIGAAVALELSAESKIHDAEREPNDAVQDSLWHSANTRRYLAEGVGVAGVACAAAAVWQYLTNGWVGSAVEVAPVVTTTSAGVALLGRF